MNRKYANRRYLDALEKNVFDGAMGISLQEQRERANTACNRSPATNAGAKVVGALGARFQAFCSAQAGSGKMALSCPAHQYPYGA